MVFTCATYEESLGWRRLLIVAADYRVNRWDARGSSTELRQCAARCGIRPIARREWLLAVVTDRQRGSGGWVADGN